MFYKVNKLISIVYSLILVGLLVLLDQWTKHLAVSQLMNKSDIILIPNLYLLVVPYGVKYPTCGS